MLYMRGGQLDVVAVCHRWGANHHRIHGVQQGRWVGRPNSTVQSGSFLGKVAIGVGNKGKLNAFQHRQNPQVVSAHFAQANQADSKCFVVHCFVLHWFSSHQ
jgi:hypothetical protein